MRLSDGPWGPCPSGVFSSQFSSGSTKISPIPSPPHPSPAGGCVGPVHSLAPEDQLPRVRALPGRHPRHRGHRPGLQSNTTPCQAISQSQSKIWPKRYNPVYSCLFSTNLPPPEKSSPLGKLSGAGTQSVFEAPDSPGGDGAGLVHMAPVPFNRRR